MVDTNASKGNIPAQGYRDIYPLHTASPLILPRSAAWDGINIEHHIQPPAECKLCLPQHTICILLGECRTEWRVDGGPLHHSHVGSGDVIVYPAFSEHWVRWQNDADFLLLFLDPTNVLQVANELGPRNAVEIIASAKEKNDPLLQQIGLALKNEIDESVDPFSSLYAESLTNTLSAHLLRRYSVWKPVLRPSTTSHAKLSQVVDYIYDNLDQHLTLAELSFIADMSSYHFARTFKQFTGVTPHQYVLNLRVERAKSLLLQGKLPLSAIASKVGFFDQSHFTRAFKRIVGVTPRALLRQNGKNLP